MLKVLIAGLLGTLAGIAVMVVVIVATGSTTEDASSVGLNPGVSTAALSAPASAPASSAPASTPGGGSGSSSGATGDATAGKTVFASSGCGSCHTLSAAGATGTIGPDLDKAVAGDAQKDNMPLAAFIKQSITDPTAYTASGGPWSAPMPTTFGSSLSPAQIDDLVALIESSQSS
jgi:cytochrome c551/c552